MFAGMSPAVIRVVGKIIFIVRGRKKRVSSVKSCRNQLRTWQGHENMLKCLSDCKSSAYQIDLYSSTY